MRTSIALRFLAAASLCLAAFAIAGCGSALNGSASMRIDVEVYNGPLAKTRDAQLAELKGTLKHAARALKVVEDGLFISECRLGCLGDSAPQCLENGRGIWLEAKPAPESLQPAKDGNSGTEPAPESLQPDKDGNSGTEPAPESLQPAKDGNSGTEPAPESLQPAKDGNSGTEPAPESLQPAKDGNSGTEPAPESRRPAEDGNSETEPATESLQPAEDGNSETEPAPESRRPAEDGNSETEPAPESRRPAEDGNSGTEAKFDTDTQDTLIQVCPMIVELKNDAKLLSGEFESVCTDTSGNEHLTCASEFGHRLRSTAEFWATKHIGILSDSRRARIGLVELTNVAAELGNEVAARADALLKQNSRGNGLDAITREQLPTSTYLQDSGATDYLNLVTWFDAAVDRPDSTKLDRVRMIERLITDTHWSKINTVFAAGQGDVRMVFIKDDIGNWNLKSFSNDPTELVNAYKKVGFAALSTAAGLASSGGSPGEVQNFMQFANDVALGSGGSAQGPLSVESLHDNTARRLNDLIARQERRADSLEARINELNEETPALEQAHQAQESGLRALVTERNELVQNRENKEGEQETLRTEIAKLEVQRDAGGTTEDDRKAIEQQIVLKHARANQLEAEIASLDKSMEDKDADITAEEVKLRRSSHALIEKQNELAAALAEQKRLGADTRAQARTILAGHEDLIDQLQSSVVESSRTDSPRTNPAGSGQP